MTETFESLREQGNKKYRQENYTGSLICYTRCIDLQPSALALFAALAEVALFAAFAEVLAVLAAFTPAPLPLLGVIDPRKAVAAAWAIPRNCELISFGLPLAFT